MYLQYPQLRQILEISLKDVGYVVSLQVSENNK